ncbi:MAG: rhomboid family intramembrane serine protease, partial [bacterium]|nr:rhomboid family intramembrane serine protease [bacterium]
MGWQERDYAREPHASPLGGFGRQGGSGIWGGSIVKKLLVANIGMYVLCYVLISPLSVLIRGSDPTARPVLTPDGPAVVIEHHPGYGEMVTTKVLHGQIWRLVTSQYLHSPKIDHLIFNMIGLFFLGQALERHWGNKKFFVIYTLAGVCGNLLLLAGGVAQWIDPDIPAVGASGCILGLLGAAAVMFPRAEVLVYFLFPVKIRTVAVIFGVWYVYNIWQRGSNYGGDLCHLAGLAFGIWWAWRGERWWATRTWRTPGPRKPNPPIWSGAGKGAWSRKVEQRVADEGMVDDIL